MEYKARPLHHSPIGFSWFTGLFPRCDRFMPSLRVVDLHQQKRYIQEPRRLVILRARFAV